MPLTSKKPSIRNGGQMSARQRTTPTPTALANELRVLLSRYADLVSAQHDALLGGTVRKASMLAKSAEHVLAEARRTDRRLTAARTFDPIDMADWADVQHQRQTALSQVRSDTGRLGNLLAVERTRLLNEIRSLEPNGSKHGPTSLPPALINIRT